MIALLIIDMQNGCFAGSPPRHDAAGTIARINQLAGRVRPRGPVIFIQHTDAREGLARDSDAWHLLDELDRAPGDVIEEKTACDAFLDTGLQPLLDRHAVTELIITGCATDFCVDTTLRSACSRGFAVTIPNEAIQQGAEGNFVYVIKDDGRAEVHKVETAAADGGVTAISKGLNVGEIVVTDGQLRLSPGAKVKVREAGAARAADGNAPEKAAPAAK